MHMGLSNDPEEHYRAELMSHFILRKIPNTITDECGEVFNKKTESKKLQVTRASMAKITPLEYVEPPVIAVSNLDGEAVPSGKKQQIEPVSENGAQGDKSNKLSDVTLWQSNKVTPVGDNDHLEMVDMEGHPDASHREKPTNSSDPQRANLNSSMKRETNIRKVPLKEMFCGEAYVFKSFGLSSADAVAAYNNITQAGCTSSEELLLYLDEHKQYRVCNCSLSNNSDSSSKHDAQCSSRAAGAWTESLTSLRIPAFHAVKIIQGLKAELK